MTAYTPTPAFGPADHLALSRLMPTQVQALYRICCQAQTSQQQPHPDDFFDSKEIAADAAALAGLCLNQLTQLSTVTVDKP